MVINLEEELVLYFICVDDTLGPLVGLPEGVSYCRAFVLRNVATGKHRGLMRFTRPDKTHSWTEINHDDPEYIRDGLVITLRTCIGLLVPEIEDPIDAVKTFTAPPESLTNPMENLKWMLDNDLLEISAIRDLD